MSASSLPTFEKRELAGIVAIGTFGLTALMAVAGGGTLVPIVFILGYFLLLPLIGVLGDRFPLVEPEGEEAASPETTPIEDLRRRYANGELTEAEFERRLDRLLETEDLKLMSDEAGERDERAFELE